MPNVSHLSVLVKPPDQRLRMPLYSHATPEAFIYFTWMGGMRDFLEVKRSTEGVATSTEDPASFTLYEVWITRLSCIFDC